MHGALLLSEVSKVKKKDTNFECFLVNRSYLQPILSCLT